MAGEPMTGTARGPYKSGLRRRELIVQQASAVFAERGYATGSLRAIAERVGVSPASLIQHFGTKERLLMAVLDDWRSRTARVAHSDRVGLEFFRNLGDVMRFHLAHPGLLELFLRISIEATQSGHPAREFIDHRYRTVLSQWGSHLSEARRRGEVSLSEGEIGPEVRRLAAVADGLELQWLLDPSIDLVGLFEGYLSATIARWTSSGSG